MTITVVNIDQGPFTATGLAQTVAYTFMTLTDEEISVFFDNGDGRVEIDPALYTVDRNKNVDGSAREGGSVSLEVGAAPAASTVFLRANPRADRDIVWSDTGSRLKNLNEEADRQTLRALVMAELIGRALIVAPGSVSPSPQDVINAAQAVALKANKDGSGMSPFQAASFLAAIGGNLATSVAVAALLVTGAQARTVQDKASDVLSIRDFVGYDPTGAASSHVALQNAINAAVILKKPLQIDGDFKLTQGVVAAGKCQIVGAGGVVTCVGNFDTFRITTSDVKIKGLWLDETSKTGSGESCVWDTGAGVQIERSSYEDIVSFGSRGGLADRGTGRTIKCEAKNVFFRQLRGVGFNLSRNFAYGNLFECTADFNGSGAAGNFAGFKLRGTGLGVGSGGGRMQGCHVLGEADSGNANQNGFELTDLAAIWFIGDNTADSCAGRGYIFTGCNKIRGQLEASLCQGDAITFANTTYSSVQANIQGRRGLPGAQTGKHALVFSGTTGDVKVDVGESVDPTGSHVSVAGTLGGPVNMIGGNVSNSGAVAVKTLGTSSFQWTGFSFQGNLSNYDMSSGNHWLEGVFNSGGRTVFAGPGTA